VARRGGDGVSDINTVIIRIDTQNFTNKEVHETVKLFEEMELKCWIEYFDEYGKLVEVMA
jgi:hypothetical protein